MRDALDPDHWCNGGEQDSNPVFEMPSDNHDSVNHPAHYAQHPSGVECVTIAQEFPYNLGCSIKYIWRAGLKTDNAIQDLKKAVAYLQFEIKRRQNAPTN